MSQHDLLFIDCTESKGRLASGDISRIKQHVVHRKRSEKGATALPIYGQAIQQDESSNQGSYLRRGSDHAFVIRFRHKGPPCKEKRLSRRVGIRGNYAKDGESSCISPSVPATIGSSDVALSIPFRVVGDTNTILRWFFYKNGLMQFNPRFETTAKYWIDAYWEWSREDELLFDGVALYAYRKQLDVSGGREPRLRYIQEKSRIISKIQDRVNKEAGALCSSTVFAIANLAVCALQDGEMAATYAHLTALARIKANERMSAIEWMGFWCLDMRFALVSGRPPILSFYVPAVCQGTAPTNRADTEWSANQCSSKCPQSHSAGFDSAQTQLIFEQLFQLLSLDTTASIMQAPVEFLYRAEYNLRVVHASIRSSDAADARICSELFALAAQLTLWMGARFWIPVGHTTRGYAVNRAYQLLVSVPNLMDAWRNIHGHLSSLLWTLATITVFARESGLALPLNILNAISRACGIIDSHSFLDSLKEWPWSDEWHRSRYEHLWAEMVTMHEDSSTDDCPASFSVDLATLTEAKLPHKCTSNRLYLGVVEFYDA